MGDFVYDFACLAGLKNCEEVAGYVFGVDKFSLFSACLRVHVFSQDPAVQKSFNNETRPQLTFFCLDAACLNERSLSGRSPFCQLKPSEESQIHWKSFFPKKQQT